MHASRPSRDPVACLPMNNRSTAKTKFYHASGVHRLGCSSSSVPRALLMQLEGNVATYVHSTRSRAHYCSKKKTPTKRYKTYLMLIASTWINHVNCYVR